MFIMGTVCGGNLNPSPETAQVSECPFSPKTEVESWAAKGARPGFGFAFFTSGFGFSEPRHASPDA
jgi:hypothetical protein